MFTVKDLRNILKKAKPDMPLCFIETVPGGRMVRWIDRAEIDRDHNSLTLKS